MAGNKKDLAIRHIADLIMSSKRITAFTGVGISTESGIPDFRSPGGIWSKANPDEFTIERFMGSSETRKKHWELLTQTGLVLNAEPNPAHYSLAELEQMGKLQCIITQNVDNLHQQAGSSPDRVLELHGNMERVVCMNCRKFKPMGEILERLQYERDPVCGECGGILKPDAVFFGEALPQQVLADAAEYARNSDLFIVIGSTLIVYPAGYMPLYALEAGARLVIVNTSGTPLDEYAEIRIEGRAGQYLPQIVAAVKDKLVL